MKWQVRISNKAAKQLDKLSEKVRLVAMLLVAEMELSNGTAIIRQ